MQKHTIHLTLMEIYMTIKWDIMSWTRDGCVMSIKHQAYICFWNYIKSIRTIFQVTNMSRLLYIYVHSVEERGKKNKAKLSTMESKLHLNSISRRRCTYLSYAYIKAGAWNYLMICLFRWLLWSSITNNIVASKHLDGPLAGHGRRRKWSGPWWEAKLRSRRVTSLLEI